MKSRPTLEEIKIALNNEFYDNINIVRVFVANLCGVDSADMIYNTDELHLLQARWLYWYSLRYMTQDTFSRLCEITQLDGHRFALRTVHKAVVVMGNLIETDSIWKARWKRIKNFIRELQQQEEEKNEEEKNEEENIEQINQKHKITISVPDEIKNKIEIEIKTEKK